MAKLVIVLDFVCEDCLAYTIITLIALVSAKSRLTADTRTWTSLEQ